MKNKTFLILPLFIIVAISSYSQQRPKQNESRNAYYRARLQVDSLKAGQIIRIEDAYKEAMKILIADQKLSQESRNPKIKSLIDSKNRKLAAILSDEQQAKIIPASELSSKQYSKN
jgi:hypothetical protein